MEEPEVIKVTTKVQALIHLEAGEVLVHTEEGGQYFLKKEKDEEYTLIFQPNIGAAKEYGGKIDAVEDFFDKLLKEDSFFFVMVKGATIDSGKLRISDMIAELINKAIEFLSQRKKLK